MEHADQQPARDAAGGLGLERFCVALCHDLRGPVATAGAAVQRLARLTSLGQHPPAEANDLPRLVEIARRSIAKADELLTSLPALLAREVEAQLDAVALDDVVALVRDDVEVELRLAGAAFEVRGRMPVVLADRERLRVALRNLVQNALKHGRADVAALITLRAWRRGTTWTLTLSDNGSGIPRAERARIFAPLQRGALANPAGSGLGLGIARQAVEACGGSLALSSRPGAGASFAITLREAAAASTCAPALPARGRRAGSEARAGGSRRLPLDVSLARDVPSSFA